MKVRPDAQLLLARRAPPRPDLAAAGDKARKRALQCEWVASWEGHPLAADATDSQQNAWWKQAKKQHSALVAAARQRFGDDVENAPPTGQAPPAGPAAPVPISGLTLTKNWVQQHAPEIVELSVEVEGTPGGSELRHVRARVTGPDGEEEHARSIHFSPRYERHAAIFRQGRRRREECAVLALASEPKRRRMQENLEYEQQTAEALAVERREMCARLAQLDRESLRPFAMQSGGGRVLWLPAQLLQGLRPFSEPRISVDNFYYSLSPADKERHLERGCFLCRNLLDCRCCHLTLSPPPPPCCPSPQLCAADNGGRKVYKDLWLGRVPWCSHRANFRARRERGRHVRPWYRMQRRWLASDGSPAARDALLAEWVALDFCVARRRTVEDALSEEARWTLFRSADDRAAEAEAAEAAEAGDWAWMLQEIVSLGDLELYSDACARWRAQIASPRYTARHCWHCLEGAEQLGFGRLVRKGTPYATGAKLQMRDLPPAAASAAAAAKRVCAKAASQQHSWTWTVPPAQRAEELRRLPELVLRQLSDLEASAELAEAWADAFEARWGQERAVAAGVRDAVLRARGHVEQCARVRDEMEVVAREARISLRGQSPSAW